MFKFVVVEGPGKGAEFTLSSLPVTIGRGLEAEVQLDCQSAARRHARVTTDGQRVFIHTITAKRTRLSMEFRHRGRTQRLQLNPGDKIKICDVLLELRPILRPSQMPSEK